MMKDVVLTIAGSDSGGGAGIQADLQTFQRLGVSGASVITCVTAQNPSAVTHIHEVPVESVLAQLQAVLDYFDVGACKMGMLYSQRIIEDLVHYFQQHATPPLILDPVMCASSGRLLLQEGAIEVLTQKLFAQASLITPNIPKSEQLLGTSITNIEAMKDAAHQLFERYQVPFLIKGGHLSEEAQSGDYLFDGKTGHLFSEERIPNAHQVHGTGCRFSAAIAVYVSRGHSLFESVQQAKYDMQCWLLGALGA